MRFEIIEGELHVKDVDDFLARINDIASKYDVIIQVMDANKIANTDHIRFATEKAIGSMRDATNISNSLEMEILLYASGKHQIKDALEMGVSTGKNKVGIVILGGNRGKARSELTSIIDERPVLRYSEDKRDSILRFFGITGDEISATGEEKIPMLVRERVALLDVSK